MAEHLKNLPRKYIIEELIHEGNNSAVFTALNREKMVDVVIKIYEKEQIFLLKRELKIMALFKG